MALTMQDVRELKKDFLELKSGVEELKTLIHSWADRLPKTSGKPLPVSPSPSISSAQAVPVQRPACILGGPSDLGVDLPDGRDDLLVDGHDQFLEGLEQLFEDELDQDKAEILPADGVTTWVFEKRLGDIDGYGNFILETAISYEHKVLGEMSRQKLLGINEVIEFCPYILTIPNNGYVQLPTGIGTFMSFHEKCGVQGTTNLLMFLYTNSEAEVVRVHYESRLVPCDSLFVYAIELVIEECFYLIKTYGAFQLDCDLDVYLRNISIRVSIVCWSTACAWNVLGQMHKRSYAVRQSAATTYGGLCAVVCSIPIASNGRQNQLLLGGLVDRFIGWALLLLNNVSAGDGTTELALDGLRELTLISLKFFRCFQPHFLDIVDLLLRWTLVPDLGEPDRHVITDGFLQFQKHWVGKLQFSLGLLSKFLGDMDVLLQDTSPGTPKHFRRLLALLSCFSSVLQSTASGLLEINILEQILETLCKVAPHLLGCLLMVGKKFGWSKWIGDSWKCLTLLAEILRDRFSTFYPLAVDILFQSLGMDGKVPPPGAGKLTSFQVHGVLKTNLQLLSLQNLGLSPSSLQKLLHFDAPTSQLRLHPNHLVTGSSAATYIFVLRLENNKVVEQAITLLVEELELLRGMLEIFLGLGDKVDDVDSNSYSKSELLALFKFDLKVLLASVLLGGDNSLIGQPEIAAWYLKRSEALVSFIIKKLNPLEAPIHACEELQVDVIETLERLTTIEFLSKRSTRKLHDRQVTVHVANEKVLKDHNMTDVCSAVTVEHLRKYSALKLIVLEWLQKFLENVIAFYDNSGSSTFSDGPCGYIGNSGSIVFSVLDCASDREPKVRLHAAFVLELLLQARVVHPVYFYPICEVVLDKLGDPDIDITSAFVRLLSHVLPTTIYACGIYEYGMFTTSRPGILGLSNSSNLHWKQIFSLKQLQQQLHSQQLVSILSYISQREKVPLSAWIQRLLHICRSSKDNAPSQFDETGNVDNSVLLGIKVDDIILERVCSVNNLAGAWWAIHEAARYCIATRLRTNLGGPTQTFAALERMLLDIAHVLQLDSEQSLSNIGVSEPFSWINGFVCQEKGQYEKAAALFLHLLQTEESLSSMGSDSVQFAIARIIESYTARIRHRELGYFYDTESISLKDYRVTQHLGEFIGDTLPEIIITLNVFWLTMSFLARQADEEHLTLIGTISLEVQIGCSRDRRLQHTRLTPPNFYTESKLGYVMVSLWIREDTNRLKGRVVIRTNLYWPIVDFTIEHVSWAFVIVSGPAH